ncbi:MAG TPA: hypothetical protein V6C88_03750 [Chroococcidiopsis sp.]
MKVKCDRPFASPQPYPKRFIAAVMVLSGSLLGSLAGCSQSLPEQSDITDFNRSVAQYIQEHSQFGYSEAEVYLTILATIPDQAVYEFGDRTCETRRRGGSSKQIIDIIQSQFEPDDERMTYLYIAQAAEQHLCPESSFPAEGWPRSLFFWKERLNGGQPL